MIDIVGNIKINEALPERLRYCLASIESLQFLNEHSKFILNLDNPSEHVFNEVLAKLRECKFKFHLQKTGASDIKNYGQVYCELLNEGENDFVLNFHEDHFMVCDDANQLIQLLKKSRQYSDFIVIRCSFHKIERNSIVLQREVISIRIAHTDVFLMDINGFIRFNNTYSRYFIGTNCILGKKFAKRFWGRNFNSKTPHAWELAQFDNEFQHLCAVPHFEIQAAIDDDHGEPNTCLLKRKEEKFWRIYNNIPA